MSPLVHDATPLSDCSPSFDSSSCSWSTNCTAGAPFWNTPYQSKSGSCTWHFTPNTGYNADKADRGTPGGTPVLLLSSTFRTAYNVNVTVFDGPSVGSPLLSHWNGRAHPGIDDGALAAHGTTGELTVRIDAEKSPMTFGFGFSFSITDL